MEKDFKLLNRACNVWEGLGAFRNDRARNKRYAYGRQWEDRIEVEGRMMTEADYIRSQGSIPLKNNMIRRLVRNVLGVWRSDWALPKAVAHDPAEASLARVLNRLLECNAQTNRLTELYARTLEEFLISGMAIHRKSYSRMQEGADCRTDLVNPDNFFFYTDDTDFRNWEFQIVGEIHDIKFSALCSELAHTGDDISRLSEVFGLCAAEAWEEDCMCRVTEVWERIELPVVSWCDPATGRLVCAEVRRGLHAPAGVSCKWEMRRVWRYSILGPQGEVLARGLSPYAHGSHPYVVKAYPFVDGEIHSFVADVIDQQRYTNRLITLYDWVMRSSAKGVLLFPEGALPDGLDLDDVAEEWSRFNGVLMYRARAGMPLPQQVSGNTGQLGIAELLDIQLKMFEDISGVNSALQGKLESSSVSGTLFRQQTDNALISLRDLLYGFREFIISAARMDAENMLQYYTPARIKTITGACKELSLLDRRLLSNPRMDFRFE